jgi:hypothetical protein
MVFFIRDPEGNLLQDDPEGNLLQDDTWRYIDSCSTINTGHNDLYGDRYGKY